MHPTIRLRALANDEDGQDLLEYALLVGLIAVVAILAVTGVGGSVADGFERIPEDLEDAGLTPAS